VKVEYVPGANPSLTMKGEKGEQETIDVSQWKTETYVEFLQAKMKPATA
jgi:hypothetical protein